MSNSGSWLVVGLGNPGAKYRSTRHNVGFQVLERLVKKRSVTLREKGEAVFGEYVLEGRKIHLLFPQTFMNESGRCVAPFASYRQIPSDHLLVVSDDLDLPPGRTRLRASGGSGGHHGLDSLIAHLGTTEFPRLRLGIGKPPSAEKGADHVLAGFEPDEKEAVEKAVERAADGVELFILEGAEAAMREINKGPAGGPEGISST